MRRHRIAFSRLLELHARQKYHDTGDGESLPLGSLEVEVRLAAHTLMMEPYGPHLLPVVREVVEAIPERLIAMGRRIYASKTPGA